MATMRDVYRGPAILSYGFRPFFLASALYAALAVLLWLPMFFGELGTLSVFSPRDWHIHEMLYGYVPAVMTGFLFTAIPNWTGRLPVRGGPLLGLFALWLAGRVAVSTSSVIGWVPAAAVDCAFLVVVVAVAAREIVAGKNWRNLRVLVLISLLAMGNILFHLQAHCLGRGRVWDAARHRHRGDADQRHRRPHRSELHAQLARAGEPRPARGGEYIAPAGGPGIGLAVTGWRSFCTLVTHSCRSVFCSQVRQRSTSLCSARGSMPGQLARRMDGDAAGDDFAPASGIPATRLSLRR